MKSKAFLRCVIFFNIFSCASCFRRIRKSLSNLYQIICRVCFQVCSFLYLVVCSGVQFCYSVCVLFQTRVCRVYSSLAYYVSILKCVFESSIHFSSSVLSFTQMSYVCLLIVLLLCVQRWFRFCYVLFNPVLAPIFCLLNPVLGPDCF